MAFPGQKPDQAFDTITLQTLRQAMLNELFGPDTSTVTLKPGRPPEQLARIANILERSATNEATVYDNGLVRSSTGSSTNALTQQVERALTQVLGRAPGREPSSFVKALNAAFPTATDGKVMSTPARSVVSLYSPMGNGDRPLVPGSSLGGQLSVAQANLYRQASIIVADALRVLEGLKPFDPTADLDAVDALRELIRTQMNVLVEEFGRVDEPRRERVDAYLNTLDLSISELGLKARLKKPKKQQTQLSVTTPKRITDFEQGGVIDFADPVTVDDEALIAGYDLLASYVKTLDNIWKSYKPTDDPSTSKAQTGSYSKNLSRASLLLPVIADSNTSFMAAMDSIGFTESERRSDTALFSTLGPSLSLEAIIDSPNNEDFSFAALLQLSGSEVDVNNIKASLKNVAISNITVNDFNDWVDRFTTAEAPSILATSGKFGLDFVTDQADTLFWVISIVLYALKNKEGQNSPLLKKAFSYERVKQTLSELVTQLDTLADLSMSSNS